jgi:hypothetical protein
MRRSSVVEVVVVVPRDVVSYNMGVNFRGGGPELANNILCALKECQ